MEKRDKREKRVRGKRGIRGKRDEGKGIKREKGPARRPNSTFRQRRAGRYRLARAHMLKGVPRYPTAGGRPFAGAGAATPAPADEADTGAESAGGRRARAARRRTRPRGASPRAGDAGVPTTRHRDAGTGQAGGTLRKGYAQTGAKPHLLGRYTSWKRLQYSARDLDKTLKTACHASACSVLCYTDSACKASPALRRTT